MPTIKEAKIKIESVIENLGESGIAEGEVEKNLTEADGFFHCRENGYLLSYSENGDGGTVYSDVEFSEGEVTVRRRGALNSEMRFREGAEHSSVYEIAPYKFDMTVRTKRIRTELSADGGTCALFYNMKIGGAEKTARMKIWISTDSKQK